jgi:hypothetical protein
MDLAKQNSHVCIHVQGNSGSLLAPMNGNNSLPVHGHNNNFAEAVGNTNNHSAFCAGEIYKPAATRKWNRCDRQCSDMENPIA